MLVCTAICTSDVRVVLVKINGCVMSAKDVSTNAASDGVCGPAAYRPELTQVESE